MGCQSTGAAEGDSTTLDLTLPSLIIARSRKRENTRADEQENEPKDLALVRTVHVVHGPARPPAPVGPLRGGCRGPHRRWSVPEARSGGPARFPAGSGSGRRQGGKADSTRGRRPGGG